MNDFRHILQASNAISKIPEGRRELALQYIWKMVQPEDVMTPPPAQAPEPA